MNHRHRPLALLLFATLAATAAAHDYWMEPRVVAPATPGAIATATLRLLVGEPFRAEEERPWQPDKTPRFELLHLGGRVDLRPSLTADVQPIGPFALVAPDS